MKKIAMWLLAAMGPAIVLSAVIAFAQPTTAPAAPETHINLKPFYVAAEPYILTLFGLIISALFGWIATWFKRKTGIEIDADLRASIQQAAVNGASKAVASLEGPIGNRAIDVHSPLVVDGVNYMQKMIPEKLAQAGLTPDQIAALVQAKLGAIQAAQASQTVVPK